MKKVYIIVNNEHEEYKAFSSKKFADAYLAQVSDEVIWQLSEPLEVTVEQ